MFKIKTFSRPILGAAGNPVKAFKRQNMRKCRRSCRRFFWLTSALSLWTLKDSPPFTLTTIGEKAKVAFYELQTILKFQFLLFHFRTTTGQLSSTCSFSVAAVGGPVWLSFPMDYKEFVKKWTKGWLQHTELKFWNEEKGQLYIFFLVTKSQHLYWQGVSWEPKPS